jgi:hypothetical protein
MRGPGVVSNRVRWDSAREGSPVARKYLFADESGNFDFRDHTRYRGATQYFAVGTMTIEGTSTMHALAGDLGQLRYDLLDKGHKLGTFFHASDDSPAVRQAVLDVMASHPMKIDVTILEKAKAQPKTRTSPAVFYKYAWYYNFKWFAPRYFKDGDDLTVVSAALGDSRRAKAAMQTAVNDVVNQCCDYNVKRRFAFWPTASDMCLQAADYGLWAVMRDYERSDRVWKKIIESKVRSVYDLWAIGKTYYYGPKAAPKTK